MSSLPICYLAFSRLSIRHSLIQDNLPVNSIVIDIKQACADVPSICNHLTIARSSSLSYHDHCYVTRVSICPFYSDMQMSRFSRIQKPSRVVLPLLVKNSECFYKLWAQNTIWVHYLFHFWGRKMNFKAVAPVAPVAPLPFKPLPASG